MRVSTCMRKAGVSTRSRVLTAAGRLFAEHGLDAATTREIAREADVNEVTLFRLFQNKEGLRSAVLEHVLERQAELIAARPKGASRGLRADIHRCADTYAAALTQNLSLVRALIGEIHRPREAESRLLHTIFQPLKAELAEILNTAVDAGQLRAGVNPIIAASLLPEMILVDMLRRNAVSGIVPPYSREEHLAACVDVFLHGIVADPALLKQ